MVRVRKKVTAGRPPHPDADRFVEGFLGGAKGKVLGLLMVRADGPMHLREIARASGVAVGQLQREVRTLTDAGLLTRRRAGGKVLYAPDPAHPLHRPLADLLLTAAGGPAGLLSEALVDLPIKAAALTGEGELIVVGDATAEQVIPAVTRIERVAGPLSVTALRAPPAPAVARWLDARLDGDVTWLVGGPDALRFA